MTRYEGEGHGELVDAIAERVAALLAEREPPPGASLTAKQAAAFLAVPESWVRAEARANRLPHIKHGRYVLFDRADLEAFRDASKAGRMPRAGGLRAA